MAASITSPDYSGGSLVNLVAELERRLTGSAPSAGLHSATAAGVAEAATYVLVLMDGLGSHQLPVPEAATLASSRIADIDAPFPTTTTVSLSTIATATAPRTHGLIGYQLYLPELDVGSNGGVVNTIKWTRLWGEAVEFETTTLLPAPNLWERMTAAGVEPITVQPANFAGTSLTRALYRGCRFEPVHSIAEAVDATVQLARVPGRFILTYLPHVDFAAHVYGQRASEYLAALSAVDSAWSSLCARLPASALAVGTADHGHRDYPQGTQFQIPRELEQGLVLYGDSRAMFVRGDGAPLAEVTPSTWVPFADAEGWWGDGPSHPSFSARAPDGILVADDDRVLLHRHSDTRLTGHHGALTDEERHIPLLVSR